jgi:hypothetical protein
MIKAEFKPTHIIEILPCDILSKELYNKEVEAIEAIQEHGFYFFTSEETTSFVPCKFAKIIKEIKSPKKYLPLFLMGFFISKNIVDPDLKIRLWVYKPSENITPYQLSLLLPYLLLSGTPVPLEEEELDQVAPFWNEYLSIQDLPKKMYKSKEYQFIRGKLN